MISIYKYTLIRHIPHFILVGYLTNDLARHLCFYPYIIAYFPYLALNSSISLKTSSVVSSLESYHSILLRYFPSQLSRRTPVAIPTSLKESFPLPIVKTRSPFSDSCYCSLKLDLAKVFLTVLYTAFKSCCRILSTLSSSIPIVILYR